MSQHVLHPLFLRFYRAMRRGKCVRCGKRVRLFDAWVAFKSTGKVFCSVVCAMRLGVLKMPSNVILFKK